MTHPTWGDKPPRVAGSLPRMRPDQELQVALTRAGSGPAPQSPVVVAREVIVIGPNGGIFIYDNAGNLREADVGRTTIDPKQGITCQQGISTFNGHGAVISLNSTAPGSYGFFVYIDTGTATQGALQNVDSPINGTEPVTNKSYLQGFTAFNTLTGASTRLTPNADVHLSAVPFTSDGGMSAGVQGTGPGAFTQVSSPAQGPVNQSFWRLYGENAAGTHGPFALLTTLSAGSYGKELCYYWPGIGTDDGDFINTAIALGIRNFYIMPGTFNLITPVSYTSSVTNPISITAPYGEVFVQWTPVANTIAWKWHGSAQASGTFGELSGFTFDGLSNPGAVTGAVLVDIGDITSSPVDITVQNLTGTAIGAGQPNIGFRVSNDSNQTELCSFRVTSRSCQVPMYHRKTGAGTASLARTDMDYRVIAGPATNQGVVFDGINPYGGTLKIRGNWTAATSSLAATNAYVAAQKAAVLTLAGTAELDAMEYDIDVECGQPGGGGGTDSQKVLVVATTGTNFVNGRGILQADKGALAFDLTASVAGGGTNILTGPGNTLANATFEFVGMVSGVPDLNPFNVSAPSNARPQHINGCQVLDQMTAVTAGGIIRIDGGKRSYLTLTANITVVTLQGIGGPTPGGSWDFDIVWHNGAGNVFTVTGYPAGIKWVGGAAPVMPAGGASGTWQKVKITSVIDNTSGTPVQVLLGESNNYS